MATPTAFSTIPATLRQGACTVLYVAALIGGTAHANAPVPEGPLVSTEWLAANLNRADVRIVEVSVNPGLYERSHVPGAVNFSWHNDLIDHGMPLARPDPEAPGCVLIDGRRQRYPEEIADLLLGVAAG